MKKRIIYRTLLKNLEHKNALVITGMRQVGKTTVMKQIYYELNSPKLWFDFDNPFDTMYFENIDYHAIYATLRKESGNKSDRLFIFIDEIQNFPDITKIIKFMIDHYHVKFIVTGSSNYYLKNLFPESLNGRKFLFVLHPMSFTEYLYFNDKYSIEEVETARPIESLLTPSSKLTYKKYESDYLTYMEFGGFPEVVITEDTTTKREVLKNIFTSFFEKDIKLLSDFKDIRELRDLILLLAQRTGNILDITKLASELGVNRVKLYSYLEFLQGVFLIRLLPKYSASIDRSIAGGKKVYFSDNGLLNVIGKLNEGQILENAVANQLLHYGELSYYNKRNTAEIDFILNKEIGFEVKTKATESDVKRLHSIGEKLRLKDSRVVSLKYVETENTIFSMQL